MKMKYLWFLFLAVGLAFWRAGCSLKSDNSDSSDNTDTDDTEQTASDALS